MDGTQAVTAAQVVAFWRDAGPAKWFERDDAFDDDFRCRFEAAHFAAARGELAAWGGTSEGALALLLLLDQYPRNCFRGNAHSYATDGLARRQAREAIAAGLDLQVETALRLFFYLPFEHSEALPDQDYAMQLIAGIGQDELMEYAQLHRDLIARFGRFPHRNAALGREPTQAEVAYLAAGGFSG
ncbi:DUF924 family protein [Pseudoxanthomonas gei]|uniref:DUF924 family protein n=1 Tax=Pseudoxanthomonas gei TaxID=1383030 RepID=A0ABX0AIC2_9GAMM|nr:DUF924 family protein [Pseudoxanthomonas gei]NDK39009.1 DUF924 family protein [Pseudoxanthomonas gei]